MATEQQVRIAARLYEMRDAAKALLGDKYSERMALYADVIRQVQAKLQLDELGATLRIVKGIEADGYETIMMMAAYSEMIEPTQVQHSGEQT